MTSVKRSHRQTGGSAPGLALGPGAAPHWRLLSSLMLALLAAILLVRPGAAMAQAGGAKAQAKPALNVVVIGDFYSYGYAYSADPALRGSVPPTLQALNQIQAANPGIQVNVLFIPVKDATRNWLPPVVNAVRDANIVIVGVGANDARFTDSMRTVLFGAAASAKAFPQLMAVFDNGSFLQAQAAFLGEIAARAAPGASIVTLGYPTVLAEQLPAGFTWWSPFRWASISQQQANMSNQLVSALNMANDQATSITAAHHPGLHFLYADLSGALQGKGPFGPQPGRHGATPASTRGSQPADLRQTLIGSDLLPYVDQAVNDELSTKGLQGAQDIPPITPKSRWKLTVHEPVEVQVQPTHPKSNVGVNTQPQINGDNPANQPASSANLPGNPADTGGPTANGQQASGQDRPSISIPSADIGQIASAVTGQRQHGDHGRHSTQPVDTVPSGTPQPVDTGQPTGTPQPSGTGLPTGAAQPLPTRLSAGTPPGGCPASMSGGACQDCGIVCSHAGNGGGPAGVPVIPAPAAPLPPPITPHEIPAAGASPGSGTTPATPATGATQAPGTGPAAPATGTTTQVTGTAPATTAMGAAASATTATGAASATGTVSAIPATGAASATGTVSAAPATGATAPAVAPATQAPPAPPSAVAQAPAALATPAFAPAAPLPATGAAPDAGITPTFAGGGA